MVGTVGIHGRMDNALFRCYEGCFTLGSTETMTLKYYFFVVVVVIVAVGEGWGEGGGGGGWIGGGGGGGVGVGWAGGLFLLFRFTVCAVSV